MECTLRYSTSLLTCSCSLYPRTSPTRYTRTSSLGDHQSDVCPAKCLDNRKKRLRSSFKHVKVALIWSNSVLNGPGYFAGEGCFKSMWEQMGTTALKHHTLSDGGGTTPAQGSLMRPWSPESEFVGGYSSTCLSRFVPSGHMSGYSKVPTLNKHRQVRKGAYFRMRLRGPTSRRKSPKSHLIWPTVLETAG